MLEEVGQQEETAVPAEKVDVDSWIGELVGTLCDPIIAWPGPWMDTIPEDLLAQVKTERLLLQMEYHQGVIPRMTATDAEALVYMYPRSLESSMTHNMNQIYIYLGARACGRFGRQVPEDLQGVVLTRDEERELADLKNFIYGQRIKHRKGRARAERQARDAGEETGGAAEEPQLGFDLWGTD